MTSSPEKQAAMPAAQGVLQRFAHLAVQLLFLVSLSKACRTGSTFRLSKLPNACSLGICHSDWRFPNYRPAPGCRSACTPLCLACQQRPSLSSPGAAEVSATAPCPHRSTQRSSTLRSMPVRAATRAASAY